MKSSLLLLPIIALAAAGCGSSGPEKTAPASPVALTSAATPKNLSLETACALAVAHHPSLATYPMDRRAADARILKASRIPNPVLTLDEEDFFGTGDLGGLGASVFNSLLTQVIERGGKRQARTEAARSAGKVMDAEYQVRRTNLIQETGELYLKAVAAKENLRFLEANLQRSRETANQIGRLSEAGRVTISSLQQAKLEIHKSELAVTEARAQCRNQARALTAQWGDSSDTLVSHRRVAAAPATLPSQAAQKAALGNHPEIRHSLAQVSQSDALLKLAKANKLINPTIGGGLRNASASDQLSALASISFPLPVFNKQEDAIKEMTALAEKSRTELAGAKQALNIRFALAWSDLMAAHRTANSIKIDLLPAAVALFKSAEESFRFGKITSLEYLAAQQQFQNIRRQSLQARLDYQTKAARVQALTNRTL